MKNEQNEREVDKLAAAALWYAWGQIDPRPNEDNKVPNPLGLGTEHGQEFSRVYGQVARDYIEERRTSRPNVLDAWKEFVLSKQRLGVDAELTVDDIDRNVRYEREHPIITIYLKGWQDSGLYHDAVNNPIHARHNEAMAVHQRSFVDYKVGDVIYKAFSYRSDTVDSDDTVILERAFRWFNVSENLIAERYRMLGNRSLSVGDVVVIGDRAYSCDSAGWSLIENFPGA